MNTAHHAARRAHFDVLVIGTPCLDLVFAGLPHWPIPGQELYVERFGISAGAAFNTAATLSRLGLRVALLCELGNDLFSRYILEEMERASISRDLVLVREHARQAVSVALVHEGERGFVSYTDTPGGFASQLARTTAMHGADTLSEELSALLASCDFDAAFLYVHPGLPSLLDAIAERQATIFFDTGWHPEVLADPRMPAVVARGDYMLPNQAEAMFMTGTETAEEAVRVLAKLLPVAVVKVGARGAIACQQAELTYCPAFAVKEVLDTTGAGDAFNAGFIYGVLKGYSLPESLRCGTICGSLSTTALTGTAAVPTAQTLEELRAGS
ncbi:MAG: PfkB family carbohydrate kinase [Chloroflexota bacterium]|nr:PfkB family carbohydrate kinase [Chloroflexota bacterium]